METLENMFTVAWAMRVVITVGVLAIVGAFHAAEVLERRSRAAGQ